MTKKLKVLYLIIAMLLIFTSCNQSIETISPDTENGDNETNTEEGIDNENNGTSDSAIDVPEKVELTEEEKAQIELENRISERLELEKQRKLKLGEFYVPLIPIGSEEDKKDLEAKGLYITGYTAALPVDKEDVVVYSEYVKALEEGDAAKINELYSKTLSFNNLERIIGMAISTEINALVIDVKNDSGKLTYKSEIDIIKETHANHTVSLKDAKALIDLLDEYGIYTIGRIVTFKDKNLAYQMPEHSIQLKSGGVWHDYNGTPWVNPFDEFVWDYNIAIAKEAALIGFDEIQFDYVRFPDNARAYNPITEFPNRNERDKDEAIAQFLEYAKQGLEQYNVNIGADVFGLITHNWDDQPEDIGQTWRLISRHSDVICPMIYPSHYGSNWYGFEIPDQHPYGVMRAAVKESIERNAALENPPEIRPWIQDFTATWVDGYIVYGAKEVKDQIIACKELGVNGYLVWNPGNNYNPKNFVYTEEEKNIVYPIVTEDEDLLGRTPIEALERYLYAERYYDPQKPYKYKIMYLLTPIDNRSESFDEFRKLEMENNRKLVSYDIYDWEYTDSSSESAIIDLYYKYEIPNGEEKEIIEVDHVKWKAVLENNIWKIKKSLDF